MKTVEIIRGTFEGKYHARDQVAVSDQVADILINEKFAKIVESEDDVDVNDYQFASRDEIIVMDTKKELETYAASIGMLSLDGRMKIKDMQNAILNYQEELIAKHEDLSEDESATDLPEDSAEE
ncbi:MAG: hypothetical protein J6C00_13130 [Eubacterium sp.]|nr:hypothetical protein [Eubacterium sp.]